MKSKLSLILLSLIFIVLIYGCESDTTYVQPTKVESTPSKVEAPSETPATTPSEELTTNSYVSLGEECAYVRAEGVEIKTKWYKECSTGTCSAVKCDYMYESPVPSEGSIYNCYGICKGIKK